VPHPGLVLASTSPRRAELLRALGLRARVVAPRVDENGRRDESPDEHVLRLAEAKARAAAAGLAAAPGDVVLGADTVVVKGSTVLGKPADAADAERMLRLLRGSTHEVLTAVCLVRTDDRRSARALERSRVRFRAYDDETIRRYVSSGEARDKAGAYAIQGLGALLSLGIEGSWSNVVGLPLEILPELFAAVGVDLWDLIEPGPGKPNG